MPVNIWKSYKYVNYRIRNTYFIFSYFVVHVIHMIFIYSQSRHLFLPYTPNKLSYRELHREQRHILGGLLYLRCGGGGAPVAILSWVCKVKSTL